MTSREKKLAVVFAGTLVAVVTGWSIKSVVAGSGKSTDLNLRLTEYRQLVESGDFWKQRDDWMTANLPEYETEVAASSALVKRVEQIFKLHNLDVTAMEFPETEEELDSLESWFYRTAVSVTVVGEVKDIVQSIHTIQTPREFTGVDGMQLESSGTGGMQCVMNLTHWYMIK